MYCDLNYSVFQNVASVQFVYFMRLNIVIGITVFEAVFSIPVGCPK